MTNIKMEIWDVHDNQRVEYTIGLDEISFKNAIKDADAK